MPNLHGYRKAANHRMQWRPAGLFIQMDHQLPGSADPGHFRIGCSVFMNPYDPPTPEPETKSTPKPDLPKSTLRSLLVPTLVGGMLGSIFFASDARSPGDPSGHGIAFGFYGLLSLFVAILIRLARRYFRV